MAMNNTTNRTRNSDEDVNTNGIMLKNYDKHKFLTCSFWNKAVTIEIGSIPEGAESDFTVLRKVQTIKQVMSFNTLTTLDQICEDVLDSVKKTGQLSPAGAPCGAQFNNVVEVTDGSNLGLDKGIYLVIYKDLDNNRQTQKMDVYPFSTRTVLRSYDHNSGRCVEDIDKVRDFKDFAMWVHEACKAFTYAQAHAIQEISKKDRFGQLKAISMIAASLGVDLGAMPKMANSDSNNGGYQKKSYGGNGGYNNNNRGYSNGGYKNGSTGYRGGSTGGYQNRNNGGYNSPKRESPFTPDNNAPVPLELNMNNVSDIPIEQFV